MKSAAITVKHTPFMVKDPYSALTHFIGIVYSAVLSPLIMLRAINCSSDRTTLISIAVFTISMILLYSASTAYHTFSVNDRLTETLKKIDHCMIFVLIAGTYTPVCLTVLGESGGPRLLMYVWIFAFIGIIFKLCWVFCPKWVSSVIYICMGWSCAFVLPSLYRLMLPSAFLWLVIGGLIYTFGGIIYALKLNVLNNKCPDFGSHEIFHVCVMLGNIAHFICIWQCL